MSADYPLSLIKQSSFNKNYKIRQLGYPKTQYVRKACSYCAHPYRVAVTVLQKTKYTKTVLPRSGYAIRHYSGGVMDNPSHNAPAVLQRNTPHLHRALPYAFTRLYYKNLPTVLICYRSLHEQKHTTKPLFIITCKYFKYYILFI